MLYYIIVISLRSSILLVGLKKKLEVDQNDILGEAIAYYKSSKFDASCPLRIIFIGQPAVDTGGVLRQFFTEVFEKLVNGELIELFEGDTTRKLPSYRPQAILSGMLEMTGKMIAHSIVQNGPGFPYLATPCYYYLVTGDVTCAMAYCNYLDIPDSCAQNTVLKVGCLIISELMLNIKLISLCINNASLHIDMCSK